MKVYLASRSPRRRELLEQINVEYEVVDIDIDESWQNNEKPIDYVQRIAEEKAIAGKDLVTNNYPVLAADTAVVLEGHILGKAETKDDAIAMLSNLSGKTHEVLSAVTLIYKDKETKVNVSKVTFKELTEKEIEDYTNSNEPIGKAGGYAIQGKAAVFIERLEGSYSSVMGLPLFETQELLENIT